MLKMLIDPMGGIVITTDGYCIQRELDVSHSTAKSLLELSRAQDKNVSEAIYKHYQDYDAVLDSKLIGFLRTVRRMKVARPLYSYSHLSSY